MTKTNIENNTVATRVNTLDIREYMPEILNIRKNVLKFSINDQEELSDLLEIMFNQRLSNTNDNIHIGFCDNKNYNSMIQIKHNGKAYTIYSRVNENKLRTNLKA